MSILVCVLLFLALVIAISAIGYRLYVVPAKFYDTLHTLSLEPGSEPSAKPKKPALLSKLFAFLGDLLPSSPPDQELLKRDLQAGGYRSDLATSVFSGIKLVLCALGLVTGVLMRNLTANPLLHLVIPVGGLLFGYVLPGFVLGRLIGKRQEQIRLALADALDLLVVCTEAGCALDQAIQNVSREFRVVHRALSEEFALINMELLAGSSRSAALRNFADRTGEEDVKKLVAILIQTDRFGTSVADALRTQADYMRTRRRQAAEERAGKVGVKLVFPIFFFCMPSLVVLVAGPGLLQLFTNFLPALKGGKLAKAKEVRLTADRSID